jgi:hypothetical protein
MLAYHDPQMKYWRNMNAESWTFNRVCIGGTDPRASGRAATGRPAAYPTARPEATTRPRDQFPVTRTRPS